MKDTLDLRFGRKLTTPYCGTFGQTCAERSRSEGMLIAAMAYNPSTALRAGLKKYLKFTQKRVETVARSAEKRLLYFLELVWVVLRPNPCFKF